MSEQPTALRLAAVPIFERSITWQSQATMELRRLHALNAELLEALKAQLPGADAMGWNTDIARAAIAKAEAEKT
jgi:hypothetical protein